MKTYAMMILGCKVNDYEATYVREQMNQHYLEVDFKQKADIYIIFSCCVTNTAEAKTRKFIHDARRNNPDAYLCVVGCLSQIKSDSEAFDDVDLIIGSDSKDLIASLISAQERNNLVHKQISTDFEYLYIEKYPTRSRSFLKIQDGCNQFCSYCIIPYARGRERSGDHRRLLKEAEILAKTNKEIVLTGIHTGRYHDGEYDLYHLLCDLCQIEDLQTIRLSSIEVTEITDEIIDLMKGNDRIAHHLHIPVQSCDDKILSAMRRPYTIGEYKERIEYIRRQIPGISISTDLIVGFPGEDEESFNRTLIQLQEIRFSFIHVFPYSRKNGTLADRMEGHVDPKTKKQRVREVMAMEKEISNDYRKTFMNKTVKVLIERNTDSDSYGYSREYVYVKVKGIQPIGSLIDVVIDQIEEEVCGHAAE